MVQIAVITRIIQSEMTDLLILRVDLITETPVQYVTCTIHITCPCYSLYEVGLEIRHLQDNKTAHLHSS